MVLQEFESISEGLSERVSDGSGLGWNGAEAVAEAGRYSLIFPRILSRDPDRGVRVLM